MKKKVIALIMTVVMLFSTVVGGTIAYFTSRDSVANTFTVGKVEIILDEAAVKVNGELKLDNEGNPIDRVKGNEYHLIPGQTYVKDPTITIKAKSEESYIRMLLKVNCMKELDEIFAPAGAELTDIFKGYEDEIWVYKTETRDEDANTVTYEFRYYTTVAGGESDIVLEPLFGSFTVPGEFTGDQLESIAGLEITVEGHAIQAASFADETDDEGTVVNSAENVAWAAFEAQVNPNA